MWEVGRWHKEFPSPRLHARTDYTHTRSIRVSIRSPRQFFRWPWALCRMRLWLASFPGPPSLSPFLRWQISWVSFTLWSTAWAAAYITVLKRRSCFCFHDTQKPGGWKWCLLIVTGYKVNKDNLQSGLRDLFGPNLPKAHGISVTMGEISQSHLYT